MKISIIRSDALRPAWDADIDFLWNDAFDPSKHPRGQPKNPGQFVKGASAAGKKREQKAEAKAAAKEQKAEHPKGPSKGSDDTIKRFDTHAREAIGNLSTAERNVIREYTRNPERVERGGWKVLTSIVDRHGLPEAVTLHRGVPGETLANMKVGQVRSTKGRMVSTSLDPRVAEGHAAAGDVGTIELQAPKGTHGLYIQPINRTEWATKGYGTGEHEVLLAPMEYQIISKEEIGGEGSDQWRVVAKILPQKAIQPIQKPKPKPASTETPKKDVGDYLWDLEDHKRLETDTFPPKVAQKMLDAGWAQTEWDQDYDYLSLTEAGKAALARYKGTNPTQDSRPAWDEDIDFPWHKDSATWVESNHPREPAGTSVGGQFASGNAAAISSMGEAREKEAEGAAAKREARAGREEGKGIMGRGVSAVKKFGAEEAHAIHEQLAKISPENRKNVAHNIRAVAKSLPSLLRSKMKEELHHAKHAAHGLRALATGSRPTPEQMKGLRSLATRIILTGASVAVGDPTGSVGHLATAFGQEAVQHVLVEHALKTVIGGGMVAKQRLFGASKDAEPDEDLTDEDIALLQQFAEALAKAIEEFDPDELPNSDEQQ